jgi:hypothetical protein
LPLNHTLIEVVIQSGEEVEPGRDEFSIVVAANPPGLNTLLLQWSKDFAHAFWGLDVAKKDDPQRGARQRFVDGMIEAPVNIPKKEDGARFHANSPRNFGFLRIKMGFSEKWSFIGRVPLRRRALNTTHKASSSMFGGAK